MTVSDDDKEARITQLQTHLSAGRIDMATYEARVSQALNATTTHALDGVVADLPSVGEIVVQKAAPKAQQRVVLSAATRSGQHTLVPHMNVVVACGALDWDLRHVVIARSGSDIELAVWFGSATLHVFSDQPFSCDGVVRLGSLTEMAQRPGKSTAGVRIHAAVTCGSVEVVVHERPAKAGLMNEVKATLRGLLTPPR